MAGCTRAAESGGAGAAAGPAAGQPCGGASQQQLAVRPITSHAGPRPASATALPALHSPARQRGGRQGCPGRRLVPRLQSDTGLVCRPSRSALGKRGAGSRPLQPEPSRLAGPAHKGVGSPKREAHSFRGAPPSGLASQAARSSKGPDAGSAKGPERRRSADSRPLERTASKTLKCIPPQVGAAGSSCKLQACSARQQAQQLTRGPLLASPGPGACCRRKGQPARQRCWGPAAELGGPCAAGAPRHAPRRGQGQGGAGRSCLQQLQRLWPGRAGPGQQQPGASK